MPLIMTLGSQIFFFTLLCDHSASREACWVSRWLPALSIPDIADSSSMDCGVRNLNILLNYANLNWGRQDFEPPILFVSLEFL